MVYRVAPIENSRMKTYVFKVVLEPDSYQDGRPAWHVYCPALVERGASTFGHSKEEALKNIREVLGMTLESMVEQGETIPVEEAGDIQVLEGSRVAVTV